MSDTALVRYVDGPKAGTEGEVFVGGPPPSEKFTTYILWPQPDGTFIGKLSRAK